MAAARATVEGIHYARENGHGDIKSLQDYHASIQD